MENNKQYTIGQVAEVTGLSIHTLRFYEKEGILPAIKRNEKGIRIFDDMDLQWIKILNYLRLTGMPLAQIRDCAHLCSEGDDTMEERMRLFENHKEKVEEQMKTLRSCIDMINVIMELYAKRKKEEIHRH
ncbi:MerR family transcriptional regulator [Paenibacillus sp. P26]|nr:MerR family transcriptional regulator [Paenibacillus sp. P26]UUZ90507.1 MerR family transcriptional regulator [Paenibacillus sp. P25]